MSNPEPASLESTQTELEQKLRAVDEQLRRELRARGFDPSQGENLALTGPLAKIYLERESLRDELETLRDSMNSAAEGNC